MKTTHLYSTLLLLVIGLTTAQAQKNPRIATIGIYGNGMAKEEGEDPLEGLGEVDFGEEKKPVKDDDPTVINLFGENTRKTDDGKNTATEVMNLTQALMNKAYSKTFDLGDPPKPNALGIEGGAINLHGLPSENAKKVAKSKVYPEVYTVEGSLYVTFFKKSKQVFEITPGGSGSPFKEKAENVYKIRMIVRIKQYDENGKSKVIKQTVVDGGYVPKKWVESEEGLSFTVKKKHENEIEEGEGLTGSYLLNLYTKAITELLPTD